jgi:CBS domain-containing protein
MKASDVMRRHVLTIDQDRTVFDAAKLMLGHKISGLPVTDSTGTLVGMITEGDLLRRAETQTERRRPKWLEFLIGPGRAAEEFSHAHGRKVSEVMSETPYCVTEETPLEDVVALMEKRQIKRVPVIREGKLAGIITRANLMSALLKVARLAPPVAATDREIRDAIMVKLGELTWAPKAMVDVSVTGGEVDLHGTIFDERDRKALKVLAENVPGVKAVRDHTIWIEPYSGLAFEGAEDVAKRESGAKRKNVA